MWGRCHGGRKLDGKPSKERVSGEGGKGEIEENTILLCSIYLFLYIYIFIPLYSLFILPIPF